MWLAADFLIDPTYSTGSDGSAAGKRAVKKKNTAMEDEFREIDEFGNWNAVYQVLA